jgi:nicotinate-nucleotide adenylyltransferase
MQGGYTAAVSGSGPLAILGGTFDPPHIGHLVLAECVGAQFAAKEVRFVPAGEPYRKTGVDTPENRASAVIARPVTPAQHRLAMTRLAVAGNATFVVDDREVRRAGPTYTVDTLAELHAEGHSELILVLGSDALADLPNWRAPGRIRELARVVIAAKDGAVLPGGETVVEMPQLRISSTEIRQRVREGRPVRYLVPESVEAYIREQGLYWD